MSNDSDFRGVILLGIITAFFMGHCDAQELQPLRPPASIVAPTPVTDSAAIDSREAKASVDWLAQQTLARLPRTFDGDKDWGRTKKVWAGVKVELDGLKVKTHRRFREVEQGRWIRYEVNLPAAAKSHFSSDLQIDIDQVSRTSRTDGLGDRWNIKSSVVTPLQFTAQIQRWNLGVKLFSVTITGRMRIRMNTLASIGISPDYAKIPPDLVFSPHVQQADLVMESFEVDRISHVGGDVAEGWGEVMQELLVERIVESQSERLAEKLNQEIEKEKDNLRISMADWLTSWKSSP